MAAIAKMDLADGLTGSIVRGTPARVYALCVRPPSLLTPRQGAQRNLNSRGYWTGLSRHCLLSCETVRKAARATKHARGNIIFSMSVRRRE
jgi:hypothetical protein